MGTVNRANDSKPVQEVTAGNGRPITLGNYVLIEKIGSGGMGQVFKARHNRMDRLVALKLLPSAMTRDHAAIARFEREVKAAAKLIHPNIVAAYDADCANGVHFLVMELVEGRDLNALVKTGGPFSVDKALNCVIQAARGMESAHRKGIVHRDIKPSNLLLDVEGTVKVLDMGLARVEISSIHASIETKLTRSGAIVGTFDYMSPEQALDSRSADARADIYSLGCTLYYLITGKPIYSGNTALEKILAHREQPIPLLKDVSPLVPNALEAIFQKMVAKKIEDRYQAMSEVLVDFEKYNLGGEMTVVRDAVGSFSSLSNSPFLSVSSSEPTLPVSDNRSARRPAIAESNKKLIWICAGIVGAIILVAMLIQPSMLNNGEATSQALEYSIVSDIHQQQPVIAIATASSDKSEVVAGSESIAMDGGTKPLFCHTPGFEDWVQSCRAPCRSAVRSGVKEACRVESEV
jgi:serine/threonine protein kinase